MNRIDYIGKCLLISGKERLLIVGDLHLGYEETLNQSGIFVSREMYKEMISEFERIFEKAGKVDKIVLLGDVKHHFAGILKQEWQDILKLLDYFTEKLEKNGKIIITRGNHDNILEPIVKRRENVELVDYYINEKTGFIHGNKDFPEIWGKDIKRIVLGHVHPAIKLKEENKVEKYKCFLVGEVKEKEIIIVPSFIDASEGSDPREEKIDLPFRMDLDKFEAKIIDRESLEVLDFGKLTNIK